MVEVISVFGPPLMADPSVDRLLLIKGSAAFSAWFDHGGHEAGSWSRAGMCPSKSAKMGAPSTRASAGKFFSEDFEEANALIRRRWRPSW